MAGSMIRKMWLRDRQERKKQARPAEYRIVKIASVKHLVALRRLGWREVCSNQITSMATLAWFIYPNGVKRINIFTEKE